MTAMRGLVLVNGRVFTARPGEQPFTGGVAIVGDRIVAVGDDHAVLAAAPADSLANRRRRPVDRARLRRCPSPPGLHRRRARRRRRALSGRGVDRGPRRPDRRGRRADARRPVDPRGRHEPGDVRRRPAADPLGPRRGDAGPPGARPAHERPSRPGQQPRARAAGPGRRCRRSGGRPPRPRRAGPADGLLPRRRPAARRPAGGRHRAPRPRVPR